jgi:hypothetical protein
MTIAEDNRGIGLWIDSVRAEILPELLNDARFINGWEIVDRFEAAAGRWEARGDTQLKQLIQDGNEIAAASVILAHIGATSRLHYEPRLIGTPKSIDFLVEDESERFWIDFKTIAPEWRDDDAGWERFERIAADFPSNARLVVARDMAGAALAGQELKTRWCFIRRTIELEEKVALLTEAERGDSRLMLCTDGTWRDDALEDFADFYLTGAFRPDDWAQNAIARYMETERLVFRRNLAGFSFIRRYQERPRADVFRMHVRGPAL